MEKFSVVDGMWTIKLRRNDVQDVRRCGILGNLWSVFASMYFHISFSISFKSFLLELYLTIFIYSYLTH